MAKKTVLVTGGAAGIGAGICLRFAEAGYHVAVFDIDAEGAQSMAAKLAPHTVAFALAGDVANEQHVIAAIDAALAKFGYLDTLVNNAGIEVSGTVSDLSAAEWDRQIAVNLRGAFLMSKYAIEKMTAGGSIVNISSVHAFVSWAGCAAYDATKSGLIGLTRAMALDHGRQGIRVNAICPGYIDTPLMDRWLAALPDREETMRQLLAFHPVGRIGTPRDVAEAALFLASEAASFISGTSLVVDGAMTTAGH
jgi:meso-butanediol dehydrogenase/(S,S)-butanediol dehydrogenase/diacetyl reductase